MKDYWKFRKNTFQRMIDREEIPIIVVEEKDILKNGISRPVEYIMARREEKKIK